MEDQSSTDGERGVQRCIVMLSSQIAASQAPFHELFQNLLNKLNGLSFDAEQSAMLVREVGAIRASLNLLFQLDHFSAEHVNLACVQLTDSSTASFQAVSLYPPYEVLYESEKFPALLAVSAPKDR